MEAIDQEEDATLVVLYIGGSHVQAGWMGHGLRRELAAWAPNAQQSRGMMLPYRIAETNTPTHFRTEFTGAWQSHICTRNTAPLTQPSPIATGITVLPETDSNQDTHWIQHVGYFPDSSRVKSSEFTLWTNATKNQWKWTGNSKLKAATPLPNMGGWHIELAQPADTFSIEFIPELGSNIWYAGMDASAPVSGPSYTVHEWGHNGLRASHINEIEGWEELLKTLRPDLIFIGMGLNDAMDGSHLNMEQFQSNYAKLTHVLRRSNAAIVLMTNTPVLRHKPAVTSASKAIKKFLRDHASAHDMGFWDMGMAVQRAHNEASEGLDQWYKPDGIHFTEFGYTRISEVLFDAWTNGYTSWSNSIRP